MLSADRSVKELQHETKMMRSAFQARPQKRTPSLSKLVFRCSSNG
jgi:hypothetical protein